MVLQIREVIFSQATQFPPKRNAAVSGVTSSTLKRNASLAGLGIFLLFWAALAMLPVVTC